MNYEKLIENNTENREFIEKIKENFELFDIYPKIPVIEENKLNNSDTKACFHYDEEKDGDKIKMINKNYFIYKENIKDIENMEELPRNLAIHEIRHRIQHEDEYERQKETEKINLFSIDFINNIDNDFIKNKLLHYINSLPEQVKNNHRELDAKITEEIICKLIENNLIDVEEVKELLKSDAHKILSYLIEFEELIRNRE
jgi:hypothetical protein